MHIDKQLVLREKRNTKDNWVTEQGDNDSVYGTGGVGVVGGCKDESTPLGRNPLLPFKCIRQWYGRV